MKPKFRLIAVIFLIALGSLSESHAGFGIKTGVGGGMGTMGNESGSIQSRTMNYASVYALPVYSHLGFYAGPHLEYRLVGQSTAESSVGNSNLRGSGHTIGVAVGFEMLMFHGHVGYDFSGSYKLSNTTSSGQESIYTAPAGFRVSAGYRFMPFFSIDLNFVDHKYSKNTLAGTETDISSDKLKDTHYGLGLSFHF